MFGKISEADFKSLLDRCRFDDILLKDLIQKCLKWNVSERLKKETLLGMYFVKDNLTSIFPKLNFQIYFQTTTTSTTHRKCCHC